MPDIDKNPTHTHTHIYTLIYTHRHMNIHKAPATRKTSRIDRTYAWRPKFDVMLIGRVPGHVRDVTFRDGLTILPCKYVAGHPAPVPRIFWAMYNFELVPHTFWMRAGLGSERTFCRNVCESLGEVWAWILFLFFIFLMWVYYFLGLRYNFHCDNFVNSSFFCM